MTAPATVKKATPQQNRDKKARLIARAAWRRGLTGKHLRALPYSGEERSLTRFARMAYRESPDPADREVNVPSGPESRTWRLVEDKLAEMADRASKGLPCPDRDLLAERQAWIEEAQWPTPGSPNTSSGSSSGQPESDRSESQQPTANAPDAGTPTTEPSGFPAPKSSSPPTAPAPAAPPVSADALPRGWAELAALPPLTYDWCINHPNRRPIIFTLNTPRCADCPPQPGDWGATLNWTPKPCNRPGPCWCGRCPKQ